MASYLLQVAGFYNGLEVRGGERAQEERDGEDSEDMAGEGKLDTVI